MSHPTTLLAREVASDLQGTVERRRNDVVISVPLGGTRRLDVLMGTREPRAFVVYDQQRLLVQRQRPSLAELRLATVTYRNAARLESS